MCYIAHTHTHIKQQLSFADYFCYCCSVSLVVVQVIFGTFVPPYWRAIYGNLSALFCCSRGSDLSIKLFIPFS